MEEIIARKKPCICERDCHKWRKMQS